MQTHANLNTQEMLSMKLKTESLLSITLTVQRAKLPSPNDTSLALLIE